jgi:diguanylate cyclase (GGDEF)-like protein
MESTDSLINLVKSTLRTLRKQNINATPNNYAREFARQASKNRNKITELLELDSIAKDLFKQYPQLKNRQFDSYYELTKEYLKLQNLCENHDIKFDYLIDSLEDIISPSIDHRIDKDIKNLVATLKTHPEDVVKKSNVDRLKNISKQRIEHDKKVINDKTSDIIKLTKLMGKYFDKSLIQSGNSLEEVNKIKSELDELELSSTSRRELLMLQNKLIDTVYELGHNLKTSQEELKQNQSKFTKMQEHIEKLQENLNNARKDGNIDFLTGIFNRRAYDIELEKIENQFNIFNSKYAIVFIDIDHFKNVNDNYGHECGDAILKTFARLLNALTREGDIVVRYGGEEFVSLIKYDQEEEIKKYTKRIKSIIEENNFIYEDKKFKITFSAGVAFRSKYENYELAVKKADNLMYEAKNNGRAKIYFDDEIII